MPLTKKQREYRKYLQTDHWKWLRGRVVQRDNGKCTECGSIDMVQVHHLVYRGTLTDALLEDLTTLCRKCHRLTHGFGPDSFRLKSRQIYNVLMRGERPLACDWIEIRSSIQCQFDYEDFARLMFLYVFYVISSEREPREWWIDKEKTQHWRRRGEAVKCLILSHI